MIEVSFPIDGRRSTAGSRLCRPARFVCHAAVGWKTISKQIKMDNEEIKCF